MENELIRKIDTRALGITNIYTEEQIVEKGLADDERLLTEVFKIFNKEFYEGKLMEPIIHISTSVKEKVGIKITSSEEWIKYDNGKHEKCRGLYFSDIILRNGITAEAGMKNAYIMLAVGMITLYDTEMKEAYKSNIDIRSEEEKANDKNGKRRNKKKYRGMVTRGGYYYTEEFAAECKRIGIEATPIKDDEGKPIGRYTLEAGELFINVLIEHDLLNRRFVCAKYNQNTVNKIHKKDEKYKFESNEKDKPQSSVRTYQCPICKLKVRGKKYGIKIKCCSDSHIGIEQFMEELKRETDTLEVQNEIDMLEAQNGDI